MNDTFELITRPVGVRLIDAEKLTNDEMEKGLFPIYYNKVEDYALECIHQNRINVKKAFLDMLDRMISDDIAGEPTNEEPKGLLNGLPKES